MQTMTKPSSLRNLNQILLLLGLVFVIMHYAQQFFIPVAISGMFAMMLVHVCRFLERRKFARWAAAASRVLVTMLIVLTLADVLIYQVIVLSQCAEIIGAQL